MRHCDVSIPEFGTRLMKALNKKEMSKVELARRLGVDRKAVYTWTNDQVLPTSGYLKLICEILDVSADWLLELKEQNNGV